MSFSMIFKALGFFGKFESYLDIEPALSTSKYENNNYTNMYESNHQVSPYWWWRYVIHDNFGNSFTYLVPGNKPLEWSSLLCHLPVAPARRYGQDRHGVLLSHCLEYNFATHFRTASNIYSITLSKLSKVRVIQRLERIAVEFLVN